MDNLRAVLSDAGSVLRRRFKESVRYTLKGRHDFVSDADREVEALLITGIRKADPCAGLFSEETGQVGPSRASRWILDPLDGTANFIFGVPYFSVSAALERGGRIVAAYVYNPMAEELFHADEVSGQSFLNEEPIASSTKERLGEALVVFGFSVDMGKIQRYHEEWPHVFGQCRKGLGLLAPSLNACNVARGRIDCFIDFGSSMEGHTAAGFIVQCAKGAVKNYEGSDWDHRTQGIVAANEPLMEQLFPATRE